MKKKIFYTVAFIVFAYTAVTIGYNIRLNEQASPQPAELQPAASVAPARVETSSPDPYVAPTEPEPAAAASAQCVDGTYSYSVHRQGTCSHHGGVSEWY